VTHRIVHTMLRVRDLSRALGFYCGLLGMRERRRIEFASQRYTLAFLGYGDDPASPEIELWHDWDRASPWATGDEAAFGHVGIAVGDLGSVVETLRSAGVPVRREPGPMRPGGRPLALVLDPEGNEVELLAAL
jgi:lactoylglutathione lyase